MPVEAGFPLSSVPKLHSVYTRLIVGRLHGLISPSTATRARVYAERNLGELQRCNLPSKLTTLSRS